jgi:hypothetical protein
MPRRQCASRQPYWQRRSSPTTRARSAGRLWPIPRGSRLPRSGPPMARRASSALPICAMAPTRRRGRCCSRSTAGRSWPRPMSTSAVLVRAGRHSPMTSPPIRPKSPWPTIPPRRSMPQTWSSSIPLPPGSAPWRRAPIPMRSGRCAPTPRKLPPSSAPGWLPMGEPGRRSMWWAKAMAPTAPAKSRGNWRWAPIRCRWPAWCSMARRPISSNMPSAPPMSPAMSPRCPRWRRSPGIMARRIGRTRPSGAWTCPHSWPPRARLPRAIT